MDIPNEVHLVQLKLPRGRPKGNGPGATKNCCYGICKSDSRKMTTEHGIFFLPFPKPCLQYRKYSKCAVENNTSLDQKECSLCEKAIRWQLLCGRHDKTFDTLQQITKDTYICSLHFVGGEGPTPEFEDPLPANKKALLKVTLGKRTPPKERLPLPTSGKHMKVGNPQPSQNDVLFDGIGSVPGDNVSESVLLEPFCEMPACTDPTVVIEVTANNTDQEDVFQGDVLFDGIESDLGDNGSESVLLEPVCEMPSSTDPILVIQETDNKADTVDFSNLAMQLLRDNFFFVSLSDSNVSVSSREEVLRTLTLCISVDTIKASVFGKQIQQDHPILDDLHSIVPTIWEDNISERLVKVFHKWYICVGVEDEELVQAFKSSSKISGGCINKYTKAVHSKVCDQLICVNERCRPCERYCSKLRKGLKRKNNHGMRPDQLLHALKCKNRQIKKLENKCKILKDRICRSININEEAMSEVNSQTLIAILRKGYRAGLSPLAKLFINEQLKAASMKSKNGMRWHPLMLKLCLYLQQQSPSTYKLMKDLGFIQLPDCTTLRNYGDVSVPGFCDNKIQIIVKELNTQDNATTSKQFFAIAFDEMSIKDDIVYDRHSGKLIGMVNVNSVPLEVTKLPDWNKSEVASTVLQLSLRGMASSHSFPLAFFPIKNLKSEHLYEIVWQAVKILEMNGVKIAMLISDGCGTNLKFYKMCCPGQDIPYKTPNLFSQEKRFIYLVSDVPHLMKTSRNCFSNSNFHTKTRLLWNQGDIFWTHILQLLEIDTMALERCCPKITDSHVYLTPQSLMKVNLATQVLSNTVACGLQAFIGERAEKTIEFVQMFNKFFDILNTRNCVEGKQKRNKNMDPFYSVDDPRLKWLEEVFLKYFITWEDNVQRRPGKFTPNERARMMLSRETVEGIRITVKAAIEATKFLLENGAKFVQTHHFNQDFLEQYFAKQRRACGSNENPTVFQSCHTTSKVFCVKEVLPIIKNAKIA